MFSRIFHGRVLSFTSAVVCAYLIGIAVAYVFVDVVLPTLNWLQFKQEIAHACGVIFPVFTSYLGHKYFSFK